MLEVKINNIWMPLPQDIEAIEYEPTRQSFLDAIANGAEIREIISEEITTELKPDWDMFNALMLQNSDFIVACNQVNSTHPLLLSALTAALTQVATNGVGIFPTIFNMVCQLGSATTEQRESWSQYAIAANLPDDFVAVIAGN